MELTYRESRPAFEDLVGQTFTAVRLVNDTIEFENAERKYVLYYEPDCCASCDIEDICGDLEDLENTPILFAELATSGDWPDAISEPDYQPESFTWSFYRLRTLKGSVVIRWYGSSNGYYSETATFARLK